MALFLAGRTSIAEETSGLDHFERRIRPVLVKHCYECHSAEADELKGGLRLDTSAGIRRGGDSGAIVVPGEPEKSPLVAAVAYDGEFVDMPPRGKLPDRVVADFRKWVEMGAPLPEDEGGAEDVAPQSTVVIDEAARDFWSFRAADVKAVPEVSRPEWVERKLDTFVLRRLDEANLRPSPEADRRTLIRRLSFDLLGLPPTYDEVRAFEKDPRPDAYVRLVDRLLASPHYGERWGRHWLDVARYAEDNPTNESTCKPPRFPHPYRDWVIGALNADLPYDEFVRRQLAADLMEGLPPEEVAATGFLGLSPVYHKEPKLAADVIATIVADEWDERIDTVTRGLLGLTVACARCHDHKFDPIRTEDYYALAGVMASTRLVEWPLVDVSEERARRLQDTREAIVDVRLRLNYAKKMRDTAKKDGEPTAAFEPRIEELEAELKALEERELFEGPIANGVRDAGLWIDGSDPAWTTMDFRDGRPRDLPVFLRGNPSKPGEVVPRRFLEVLSPGQPEPFRNGSGRLELANAIFTDGQSLAARVIVNRVWGWHFGQPLVRTPSNLGKLGDRPSHPDLLDDLAARFVRHGWSLKWLHREILLSSTWRQSSVHVRHEGEADPQAVDPDNRLLWRANRRRLEPEAWRDTLLAVAGRLRTRMGGPSAELDAEGNFRRSVYGKVSRQKVPDVLRLWDFPDAKRHTAQRTPTITPLQQLYLLNSDFVQETAGTLAKRVAAVEGSEDERLDWLFRRVLQREATSVEREASRELLGDESMEPMERWGLVVHGVLASNGFLYVD